MIQTFYSLIAVFVFTMVGLTMHRHVNNTERNAIASEIESVGLDVALFWANRVKDYAFDEAVRRSQPCDIVVGAHPEHAH
ncbi:MAG: hypothetical protein AAFX41_09975, partial [Bacteroidota bacterium]